MLNKMYSIFLCFMTLLYYRQSTFTYQKNIPTMMHPLRHFFLRLLPVLLCHWVLEVNTIWSIFINLFVKLEPLSTAGFKFTEVGLLYTKLTRVTWNWCFYSMWSCASIVHILISRPEPSGLQELLAPCKSFSRYNCTIPLLCSIAPPLWISATSAQHT